jgi:peroxiredoxin
MSKVNHRARSARGLIPCLLSCLLLLACSETEAPTQTDSGPDSTPAASTPAPSQANQPVVARTPAQGAKGERAERHPSERPVPAFEGTTTTGRKVAMRDLLGRRLVLFFFNPEVSPAAEVGRAVQQVAGFAQDHNFSVLGVGIGSSPSQITRFVQEQEYAFPVIDDSNGVITQQLRLQVPIALIGVDAEGYVNFGLANFPPGNASEASALEQLQEALRLDSDGASTDGGLYAWPTAPELDVVSMDSGERLTIASLRGRAAIVIFFLHTCPHCHHALEAIEKLLAGLPEDKRPELVAVSVQNAPASIRNALKQKNLDFFTPYLDPTGGATDRWGVTGGVPVVLVVDPEGRIRHRSQGWNEQRDAGMLRMRVAAAVGARVPMLLDANGYTGNDACGVCHEQEYATWHFTQHATAFNTLVAHAADRRKDCIGCHVVGYEQPGGYDFQRRQPHLENVGCESCHGRGGPHLSPGFVPRNDQGTQDYAQVCGTCHNATHSLGFEYARFHERVSHERIAAMTDSERADLVQGGGPQRDLLPTTAKYVGSQACQSCHVKEFETWSASPHGRAVASLEEQGKAGEAECLACHTTAYGKPGGFPTSESVGTHPDLARVGCESCHGPGGDHVEPTAKRVGTILSLGDKCDSCVILKVCGTCHDDANDPDFEFEVEQRIDAQRHGTIESAATRAGLSAFHAPHAPRTHTKPSESSQAEPDLVWASEDPALDRSLIRHVLEHAAQAEDPDAHNPRHAGRDQAG